LRIIHRQSGELVRGIVDPGQLHDLTRPVFVERQAAPGIDDPTLRILMTREDQAAVLGSFIVVEQHPRPRPIGLGQFFALDDHAGKAVAIRDNHSQGPVRLYYIDAIDANLLEGLDLRARGPSRNTITSARFASKE